jgi:diguanylate cyclase (GGDEF)-like protein
MLRFVCAANGLEVRYFTAEERDAMSALIDEGIVEERGGRLYLAPGDEARRVAERVLVHDTRDEPDQAELERLRAEHQQISDLLSLVQDLTGNAILSESVADLFTRGFRTLHGTIPFDIATVVMFEQNLDVYLSTRQDVRSSLDDRFVASVRETLRAEVPASFASADFVIQSELSELPPRAGGGDALTYRTQTIFKLENRTAGLLLLFRGDAPFTRDDEQILEIFAAQTSLLIGNQRSRDRILNLAETDDLTGIWNKRSFRRHLTLEMERARIYTLPLSLLLFDCDDFKQINDGFGHVVGDVVLSELCGTIRDTLRPPDFFARFGGDEFAIVLPHTELTGACKVAERILARVAELAIPTDDEAWIRPSISIGITDFRRSDTTGTDLVRRADEQLYLAKRQGKSRYTAC